jgi:multiple sugar transport system ATP-binding protein
VVQVELRGLSKTFAGGVRAVESVDLTVGDGELFVVVGPSGSGKSTLLRLVAGLEEPDAGGLWIGGERAVGVPPRDRDVAMVFQHPALYPHLSVFENLAFGLRARRCPKAEVSARVGEVAAMLGLADLLPRLPRTLSGGQQQRVALGRAIARRPRVFLLDEPFSGLDAPLRAAIRADLIDLHRRLGTTMILVTHDQAEAMALGDRLAVMERGRVVQEGTPRDVYDRPATRFVAGFIGSPPMNFLPCVVARDDDCVKIQVVGCDVSWTVSATADWITPVRDRVPGRFDLGLRPEHLALSSDSDPSRPLAPAEVRRLEPLGHETIATLALGPHPLKLRLPPCPGVRVGDRVTVAVDPKRSVWFESDLAESRVNPCT